MSIFDSGMWWGCGTAPEYLISYFEMHLHDQYGAAMEILRVLAHSLTFGAFLGFVLIYGQNTMVIFCEFSFTNLIKIKENLTNGLYY